MELHEGLYVVLPSDGKVFTVDGAGYGDDIEDAPQDLKLEDGSFLKFVQAEAAKFGLTARPAVYEWPHCLLLEEQTEEENRSPLARIYWALRARIVSFWVRFVSSYWWRCF